MNLLVPNDSRTTEWTWKGMKLPKESWQKLGNPVDLFEVVSCLRHNLPQAFNLYNIHQSHYTLGLLYISRSSLGEVSLVEQNTIECVSVA